MLIAETVVMIERVSGCEGSELAASASSAHIVPYIFASGYTTPYGEMTVVRTLVGWLSSCCIKCGASAGMSNGSNRHFRKRLCLSTPYLRAPYLKSGDIYRRDRAVAMELFALNAHEMGFRAANVQNK